MAGSSVHSFTESASSSPIEREGTRADERGGGSLLLRSKERVTGGVEVHSSRSDSCCRRLTPTGLPREIQIPVEVHSSRAIVVVVQDSRGPDKRNIGTTAGGSFVRRESASCTVQDSRRLDKIKKDESLRFKNRDGRWMSAVVGGIIRIPFFCDVSVPFVDVTIRISNTVL